MSTAPEIVPTSGTSENRNARNANSAAYSIGSPSTQPRIVMKIRVRTPLARPSTTCPRTYLPTESEICSAMSMNFSRLVAGISWYRPRLMLESEATK